MDATSSTITPKKAAPVQRQQERRPSMDATSSTITPKKVVLRRRQLKDARVIAPGLRLTIRCQPGVTVSFPGSFDGLSTEIPICKTVPRARGTVRNENLSAENRTTGQFIRERNERHRGRHSGRSEPRDQTGTADS